MPRDGRYVTVSYSPKINGRMRIALAFVLQLTGVVRARGFVWACTVHESPAFAQVCQWLSGLAHALAKLITKHSISGPSAVIFCRLSSQTVKLHHPRLIHPWGIMGRLHGQRCPTFTSKPHILMRFPSYFLLTSTHHSLHCSGVVAVKPAINNENILKIKIAQWSGFGWTFCFVCQVWAL